MARRNGDSWKTEELKVAKAVGSVRVLRQGTDAPDVRIGNIAIEVKKRKVLPKQILDFVRQAIANAKGDRWAVVMIHAPGRGHKSQRFVLVSFDEWVDLIDAHQRYYRGEDVSELANAIETDLESAIEKVEDDGDE